ncbi:MAG: NAD(P)(+) transhydrogenase (Re/Si-specific) subunit beta [Myxococcota bacterium]|jgi:NAD(P) transhydrogenase subunit beta|nr:NAD(P)(+) transhydrogenase (Re/Si-specific) subunit beta [Myxococcota bacterium]
MSFLPYPWILDVVVVVLLFVGLLLFRTPGAARLGSGAAALGLLLAIAAELAGDTLGGWQLLGPALALGSLVGWLVAARVSMIQVPALVAFQHGCGGMAVLAISFLELLRTGEAGWSIERGSGLLGLIIGAATAAGSILAGGKLAGLLAGRPRVLPGHGLLLLGSVLLAGGLTAWVGGLPDTQLAWWAWPLVAVAAGIGWLIAVRVGGADMPVLISVLNASAGLAAALCGVLIGHRLLVVCGAVVASSGSLLTIAMCRAMNRSLLRVLTGLQPPSSAGHPVAAPRPEPALPAAPAPRSDATTDGPKTSVAPAGPPDSAPAPPDSADPGPTTSPQPSEEAPAAAPADPLDQAAAALRTAKQVMIVPGYGMALAQAQHDVMTLCRLLEERGAEVAFAIHPVAGRMPGHMNVLLAEADAPYEAMLELDDANARFPNTDVALVVGACDVVNPAAVEQEGTPISGMPILAVAAARTVLVCNLDAKPGYSGVENSLYHRPGVLLLLGDAQQTMVTLQAKLTAST